MLEVVVQGFPSRLCESCITITTTLQVFARHAPRRIRARLALAQHRKAVQAAAMAANKVEVVETQCIVVHNGVTGRVAMGPWYAGVCNDQVAVLPLDASPPNLQDGIVWIQ